MGGIELRDGDLLVERAPNEFDELAIRFTEVLDDLTIEHVYVAGYLAILTGRSRSTEDIDVLLEPLDEDVIDRLVARLEDDGMWGASDATRRHARNALERRQYLDRTRRSDNSAHRSEVRQ